MSGEPHRLDDPRKSDPPSGRADKFVVVRNVVSASSRRTTGRSYMRMLEGMSNDRVTISLPDEVRRAAHRVAEERGTSFSAVVTEALTGWLRGRLVDTWLAEHQARHGEFDENELRALAAEAGVPYVGPGRYGESAA